MAKQIYSKYIKIRKSKIISITHKDIKDNRDSEQFYDDKKIRFTFLSPAKPYKGFNLIKQVLDELYERGEKQFELNVFDKCINSLPYMNIYERGFKQEDLKEIFSKTDILLAPSIWYETFGFTVLEALSYGIPVIVSENVGAKDIVRSAGIIVKSNSSIELKKTIEELSKEKIQYLKEAVRSDVKIKQWDEFCLEIESLYKG